MMKKSNKYVPSVKEVKQLSNKNLLQSITQCYINRCFISSTGNNNEKKLMILEKELRKRLGDWLDK